MILDSSALVAILIHEPERAKFIEIIVDSERVAVGSPTILETSIALRSFEPDLQVELQKFVTEAGIEIVTFGTEHLTSAQEAYRRFGRGSGHPAKLNFGDCISYATAAVANEPLLFKGDDFVHTDVSRAI